VRPTNSNLPRSGGSLRGAGTARGAALARLADGAERVGLEAERVEARVDEEGLARLVAGLGALAADEDARAPRGFRRRPLGKGGLDDVREARVAAVLL
jgi:hypothetical protein